MNYIMISGKKEKGQLEKFIILNENLVHEDKVYVRQVDDLVAVDLEKQWGITDLNQQIFKIRGQETAEWLCIKDDGQEIVFKEVSVPGFVLTQLEPNVLKIKMDERLVGDQITISNTKTIKAVMSQLTDDNLIDGYVKVSEIKTVFIFSEMYPGLSYTLYYAHSEEGTCYLMDDSGNKVWKIGHELMEYLM